MHPVKLFLVGVGVGLLIAGDIVLTWNVQKTIREYCTPTREIKNDNGSGNSRKYTRTDF